MKEEKSLKLAGVFIGTLIVVIPLGILASRIMNSYLIKCKGGKEKDERKEEEQSNSLVGLSKTGTSEEDKNSEERLRDLVLSILNDRENMPENHMQFIRRLYEEAMRYLPQDDSLLLYCPKNVSELETMLKRFRLSDLFYRRVVYNIDEKIHHVVVNIAVKKDPRIAMRLFDSDYDYEEE